MRLLAVIFALSFATALITHGQAPGAVQGYESQDAIINQAIAEARQTVQTFIIQLAAPKTGYRYLVKMRVEAEGHVEHLWVEPVRYADGVFRGSIANTPAKIKSLKRGSVIQAKAAEISDWTILDEKEDLKEGGFTQKAMERHQGRPVK